MVENLRVHRLRRLLLHLKVDVDGGSRALRSFSMPALLNVAAIGDLGVEMVG